MYCPGCATQNYEDAKFCRVCGTNLSSVALALAEQFANLMNRDATASKLEADWTNSRRRCIKQFVEGSGLLVASAMLAVVLALFSNKPDWIIIWLLLVGWMAVIGVMSFAKGVGTLIEARFMSQQLREMRDERAALPPTTDTKRVTAPVNDPRLTPVPSVTENTTELLNERRQT